MRRHNGLAGLGLNANQITIAGLGLGLAAEIVIALSQFDCCYIPDAPTSVGITRND